MITEVTACDVTIAFTRRASRAIVIIQKYMANFRIAAIHFEYLHSTKLLYTVSAKSIRVEKIFFKKTLFLKINIIQREISHRIDVESI